MPEGRTRKTAKKAAGGSRRAASPKRAKRPAPQPAQPAAGGRLRVRQVRSGIGHAATFRRTLRALGLKHHQDEVVVPDNPSMRGMLRRVHHLVRVIGEEA